MKISLKLNLLSIFLIAGFLLLILVSVFSMNLIFNSLKDIDLSYKYLAALNECDLLMLNQLLESHRILISGQSSISEELLISIRLKNSELNKKIRELKRIPVPDILNQQNDLISEFSGLYEYINSALIKRIFNREEFSQIEASGDIMREYYSLQRKMNDYEAYVNETLSLIIQSNDKAIHKFEFFFIALCAAMISALVFNLTFIRRTVLSTISEISKEMLKLAGGEARLDHRLIVNRNDEIGELAERFNTFLENMELMMLQITDAGRLSAGLGVKIETGIQKNSHISNQLKDNVMQLQNYFSELSSTIGNINKLTVNIFSDTNISRELTERQLVILHSTEASVKQTINDLSELRNTGKTSLDDTRSLIDAAEEGLASVRTLDVQIEDLYESANALGSITDTINSISANIRTLGINAAIEAARAGRSGNGFKVVSDEIVSLGEMVNLNAVRISETLSTVVSLIDELRFESDNGKKKFSLIETNAEKVYISIKELNFKLHEHEQSEQEWVESLTKLSSSSTTVAEKLKILNMNTSIINESVSRLDSDFNVADSSLENLDYEAGRLLELTSGLEQTGSENNSVAEKLRSYTSHFNS